MNPEYMDQLDLERRHGVQELIDMIRASYPCAQFQVEAGIDDPEATYIFTVVDLDDPDEVMDLVIDRLIELQTDAALPISVIPVRAPDRTAAIFASANSPKRAGALLPAANA